MAEVMYFWKKSNLYFNGFMVLRVIFGVFIVNLILYLMFYLHVPSYLSQWNTDTCSTLGKLKSDRILQFWNSSCLPYKQTDSVQNVQFLCKCDKGTDNLLTLFTTMYGRKDKLHIFNNTITELSQLQMKGVHTVLFVTPYRKNDSYSTIMYLMYRACSMGWSVAMAPACNIDGYPVLKSMFAAVYGNFASEWYAYSNGDILFDETLTSSLKLLNRYTEKLLMMSTQYMLVVGRRHDLQIDRNGTFHTPEDLRNYQTRTKLHESYGIDYFITRKYGFPWEQIPPVVIGRPAYDNYLLWFTRKNANIAAIDATEAIFALHQMTAKSDGWKKINLSLSYNTNVINNRSFIPALGSTSCVEFTMKRRDSPHLFLYKRHFETLRPPRVGPSCRVISQSVV